MPPPCTDHFQPLYFRVTSADRMADADLLSELQFDAVDLSLPSMNAHGGTHMALSEVFSWLTWVPPSNSPCFRTLHECFRGALPGNCILKRTSLALKAFGLKPGNTIYGQSICPDEINNEEGDPGSIMAEYWGNCFPMGGIGGAPFVGKTGFTAFSHHVPDDGHVVILFGPHVAISEAGELGKYLRHGQSCDSSACGAVLAAYSAVLSGDLGEYDESDLQQWWIKQSIEKDTDSISKAPNPLQMLIHVAYRNVLEHLLEIVNTNFGKGKLVLLGGIQINMPPPCTDHFQPLYFRVTSADRMADADLLSELHFDAVDFAQPLMKA